MKKFVKLVALFLLSVFYSSCGQNQTNVPQDNISKGNYAEAQVKAADTSRVPISMVRNVKKAKNGDILIASYLGVFRYDARLPDGQGTSFTNLTSKIVSPRFSSFWDVLEDRKGNLWFASKDSGVYLLPSGQTTFQHFTTKDGLASNMALHIYEDRAGNIWFGASRYDGKSLSTGQAGFRNFTTKDGFPSNSIRLLLEDKTGKLWFGAQGEDMFVYDPRPDSIGRKTFTVLKNKDGKAFNNVWSVIEDRKGNIWFGATIIEDKRGDTSFVSQGLWRYDGSTYTKVSQKGAYAIIEDKKGNIWTTGELKPYGDWALSRYDAKSLYNKKPTVTEIWSRGPALLGILEANDGSIWFGSFNGVYRYDGKTITDFKSKEGH
jgi:ligand-binding sensor domain-containing protein